jgi:hypothetical protein
VAACAAPVAPCTAWPKEEPKLPKLKPLAAGWLAAGWEKEKAGAEVAAPKELPKPPVLAALKEKVPAAGVDAPNAGAELAPKPKPGVEAGLAPKVEPKPPNVAALLAGALAPKPPKGEEAGLAPKPGVEDPKGLGEGVPKGDAADAGLAPKGEDEGAAPKPPKLGVEAVQVGSRGRGVALSHAGLGVDAQVTGGEGDR